MIKNKNNYIMKPYLTKCNYLEINLIFKHKLYHKLVHRLVAQAFIPNPENKPQVNHIDGNKSNNDVSNLEWVTQEENMKHAVDIGLCKIRGEHNGNNKYSENQIKKACELLSKNNKSINEIAKETNISYDILTKIKNKSAWKEISDKYNIPKPRKYKYNNRPEHIRNQILNYLKSGITDYGQILKLLKIEDNRVNRKYITNLNIYLKANKCSTTIDQLGFVD